MEKFEWVRYYERISIDLDGIDLLLTPIPLMDEADDGGSTFSDRHFLADAVFFEQTRGAASHGSRTASIGIRLLAATRGALRRFARQLGSVAKQVFQVEFVTACVRMNRGRTFALGSRRSFRRGEWGDAWGARGFMFGRGKFVGKEA